MAIDSTKMYGLLHETSGLPRDHRVRILRVAIGAPKGPDVHAFIDGAGKWTLQVGHYQEKKRVAKEHKFDDRAACEAAYVEARKTAADCLYPRKFAYFTFLQLRHDGKYWADFNAIEQHGSFPTSIDVVFLENEPLTAEYQWWTAAELKCHGNGVDAERVPAEAKNEPEKKAAAEAAKTGERFFPMVGQCATRGCPVPLGDKPMCKPHTRLYFQLVNDVRLGGSCSFDTTGKRSTQQLYSCIRQIKAMTGRGNPDNGTIAGISLKLVVRPYRTNHKGQPATQYGVSLERRGQNMVDLVRQLNAAADEYQQAARLQAPARQLTAGAPPIEAEPVIVPDDTEAPLMAAEFYSDADEDSPEGWEGAEEAGGGSPSQTVREPRRRSDAEGTAK